MPRPPRISIANGIYHVTARGNRLQPIYLDDEDDRLFLGLLDKVAARHEWHCLSFCLMTNHYHLALRTPNANLSIGMQWLNGEYARWFNERRGFKGHVFEKRFGGVLVETDAHLLEVFRYLALNPVRAGLCAEPHEWRWSSYKAMLGARRELACLAVDEALGYFGPEAERARTAFERLVEDGLHLATLAA